MLKLERESSLKPGKKKWRADFYGSTFLGWVTGMKMWERGGGEEKEKRRRKKKKNAERPCRSYKVISLTWPATDRLSTKLFLLFEQGGEEKEATLEYATTLVSPMVSKKTDRPR